LAVIDDKIQREIFKITDDGTDPHFQYKELMRRLSDITNTAKNKTNQTELGK
jgi:hypothetical protein